jgi:hypothetical protein
MNRPYTCHQCETKFDLLPDVESKMAGQPSRIPSDGKVRVKCPGCYEAGYTGCPGSLNPPGKGDMVYTIDLATMRPV